MASRRAMASWMTVMTSLILGKIVCRIYTTEVGQNSLF